MVLFHDLNFWYYIFTSAVHSYRHICSLYWISEHSFLDCVWHFCGHSLALLTMCVAPQSSFPGLTNHMRCTSVAIPWPYSQCARHLCWYSLTLLVGARPSFVVSVSPAPLMYARGVILTDTKGLTQVTPVKCQVYTGDGLRASLWRGCFRRAH